MRLSYSIYVIIVTLFLVSCSSVQYVSDYLEIVDPSKYETYNMEDNCSDDINPIMQIRIKNALEKKLINNNYKKSTNADLLVKYFVKNKSKKYVEECREEYARWEGGKLCEERVINYVEGSIVIDIIDTRSNTIIWHGAAFGPSWSSIKDPNQKVNEVVDKLLETYFTL